MRFSKDGILVLLNLVPVLLNYGPLEPPYWANRTVQHGQNSAKQVKTVSGSANGFTGIRSYIKKT